jgi:hypothetical protein
VPCEVSLSGATVDPDSSYAIPVNGLAACFDDSGQFALTANCPLPPVEQLAFDSFAPHAQPPLTWSATLTGTLPYYIYKTGKVGEVDCESAENYSTPLLLSENPTIDDGIPSDEGFYFLCVLAGSSATVDDTWQSAEHPTVMIGQIDTTPPLVEPQVVVQDFGDEQLINLGFKPSELSDYIFKIGAPDITTCSCKKPSYSKLVAPK